MRLSSWVIAIVVVSSIGCSKDEKKRHRVDDEEGTAPPPSSMAPAGSAALSVKSERRIEDVLVELSRSYEKEIRISRSALRSVQCGKMVFEPSSSLGDVLMALASRGLRVRLGEQHTAISGKIPEIEHCDQETRSSRYTIVKGEIRDQDKGPDLDMDPMTSPAPTASASGGPEWFAPPEPPTQKGPFEWELSDATADTALEAGLRWFVRGRNPPGPRVVPPLAPGSLADKLGLKEGDRLLEANGFSLTDSDQRLEVYARLRRTASLTLTVERAGKRLELRYRRK